MASLSNILGNRQGPFITESNLEQGEIYTFQSAQYNPVGSPQTNRFCWNSPGVGTAVIEIWGAGGSGGKMCCCGAGIPGNPGTYAKKTICVDADTWIQGRTGRSCSNDDRCFKGCSEATCIVICSPNSLLPSAANAIGNSDCQCLCAEGGAGGMIMCMEGICYTACCFEFFGFCLSCANCDNQPGCAIVCNVGYFNPRRAYGGDINCNSGDIDDPNANWSCSSFLSCNPNNKCCQQDHVAIPPGIFSTGGSVVTYQRECESNMYQGVGDGGFQLVNGLTALGRNSQGGGMIQTDCWENSRGCGCYEWTNCTPHLPPGVPAPTAGPAGDVRDHAWRGGFGAVRIRFIGA